MFGTDYSFYEDKYKEIISGAFAENTKSYKTLLKAIHLFYTNKNQQAIAILEKLENSCKRIEDITVVLLFKALSYKDLKMFNSAAETYELLLQKNPSYSRAWSNLGLLYMDMGKAREAGDALRNALAYNPENPYAYCNLAAYYTQTGDAKKALECAMKALRLFPRLTPAMSAASLACAMLGDRENSEYYFRLYAANGGDSDSLRILIDRVYS